MRHDARTGLRFFAEAVAAVALLAATTIGAHRLSPLPGTQFYVAVQLIPIMPVWLLLWVMVRHYRRIDELQRLRFLQAVSLTAGILAGVAWSWPSLQRAFGLEQPMGGMWEVYFSVVFVVVSALVPKLRAP
jgi:hypothetical protein